MRIIFYILFILNSIFGSVYTVTKSSDTNDGICDKDCSLREAVVAANKHEGFDVIKIPAGEYRLTIKGLKELYGEKGDLNINDDLYIMGDGKDKTVITGTKDDRVFYIDTFSKGKRVKLFGLTVRNGKSDYGGGILSNGDLTLENVKITDNEANNGGGILSSSSLTIQNCDILNNSARTTGELSNGFGGGVFAKNLIIIKNSILNNNFSDRDGGAIYAKTDSNLTIEQSSFIQNTSSSNGGAIFTNAKALITDTVFEKNEANDGGAIADHQKADITINNGRFLQNHAKGEDLGGGGALFNYQGTITIDRSLFDANSALGEGGGAIENTGTLHLFNSILRNNEALFHSSSSLPDNTSYGFGGAMLLIKGSSNILENIRFTNNTANISGGAIYNDVESDLTIEDSSFIQNEALNKYGGAIINEGFLNIKRSLISQNKAKLLGGGISTSTAEATLTDTTIQDNNSSKNGGGLYNSPKSKQMNLYNCKILSNNAKEYGGGVLNQSKLYMIFCNLEKNYAVKSGGAIYNDMESFIDINSSLISQNSVDTNGGGIWNLGTIFLKQSQITDNKASQIGGGIVNSRGKLTLIQSTLSKNSAQSGGAFGNYHGAVLNIEDSTINSNYAINGYGGGVINSQSTLNIKNSTITLNSANLGGAVSNNDKDANITLTHVTIALNSATQNTGALLNYQGNIDITNSLIEGKCNNQGEINSFGGNIESPSNTCSLNNTDDLYEISELLLKGLENNGGYTKTMALDEQSIALNRAKESYCLFADERGEKRTECDSGAFEMTGDLSKLSLFMSYSLKNDADKNGKISKNDTVHYQVTIKNISNQNARNVVFENPIIEGSTILTDSIKSDEGETEDKDFFVKVRFSKLTPSKEVTISFDTTIDKRDEGNITNQAILSASNAPKIDFSLNIPVFRGDPLEAFIERFYKNILSREADKEGLNYWVSTLKSRCASFVALGFFNSKEFTDKGLNNEEFVKILYKTLFDREADGEGLSHWVFMLENGKTKEDVMRGFFAAKEFKDLTEKFNVKDIENEAQKGGIEGFISRFYTLVLGRGVDKSGLAYWIDQIKSSQKTPAQAAIGFFASKEYSDRHQTDEEFIDTLYHTFFDRKADEGGQAYWSKKLKEGETRLDIVKEFTYTKEFGDIVESFDIT